MNKTLIALNQFSAIGFIIFSHSYIFDFKEPQVIKAILFAFLGLTYLVFSEHLREKDDPV